METTGKLRIKRLRLAKCLTCPGVIAHWSEALKAYVDDSGRYHNRHKLEIPPE